MTVRSRSTGSPAHQVRRRHGAHHPRVMHSHGDNDEAILGDSAEDIINAVFLQLHTNGNGPSDPNQLKSYLCSAAANTTKSRLRQARYDQPLPHESQLARSNPAASALLTMKPRTKRTTKQNDDDRADL